MSNPLLALHEKSDAELYAYAGVRIVLTFGQPQAEYAAIHRVAAVFDMPHRGIIEVRGDQRLEFLNGLLTNQTWDKQKHAGLLPGQGVYSFFLNNKGRVISDMNVLELGDRTLLEMDARMVEPVRAGLDRYLFREQVTMRGQVDELHELFLTGPEAVRVLNEALTKPIGELAQLGAVECTLFGREAVIFRDDICGVGGFVLIIPSEASEPVWEFLTANPPAEQAEIHRPEQQDMRFRGLARPIGWAALNSARIEAGRPLFGIDFDESTLPAETGQLGRAVSFTKGCFVGQEIVARMQSRGQVARQLVGIRMDDEALPIAGSRIMDELDNEIGGVTSSTMSPILSNAAICLGLVKTPFAATGTKLRIPAEGAIHGGSVVELPFFKHG